LIDARLKLDGIDFSEHLTDRDVVVEVHVDLGELAGDLRTDRRPNRGL